MINKQTTRNPATEGNQQRGGNPFPVMFSSSVLSSLESNVDTFNRLDAAAMGNYDYPSMVDDIRNHKRSVAVHTLSILQHSDSMDNEFLQRYIDTKLNKLIQLGCTEAVIKFGLVGYWT